MKIKHLLLLSKIVREDRNIIDPYFDEICRDYRPIKVEFKVVEVEG